MSVIVNVSLFIPSWIWPHKLARTCWRIHCYKATSRHYCTLLITISYLF